MKRAPHLKITLLGGFQAQLEPGIALVLPTKKSQALVAYLALPPGQAHPREKLATLLWGDMQDAQARGNLRHALSRIRKALPRTGRSGMVLDGPSVSLDPTAVDVDVARFEQLVADGRPEALEQIAGLYRGDLLAGLALAEPPFEEWLTSERERLHELAIQGLGRLLNYQQKTGAAEPAVQTCLRLLALDPLHEPVHRAVMRLYAQLGRREAALRQYQLCMDTLKRELRTQPEAETTQLHQEILRSRPTRPGRAEVSGPASGDPVSGPIPDLLSARTNLPAPPSELIGRAAALAEVTELLGAHRLVTLIGAGGIGKTRLGLEVARQLLPGFADGVWVAELAPLSDPGLVPVTVAVALRLTLSAGAESPERVAAAVGPKRLLLVLDNCEHVIDATARMAEALLRANPHACVLATSREPLRAPGEYVYRVLSLEVPAEGAQDREDLLEAAAVKLFVARARAVDLRFSPDARSAVITGAICRRLDGIPLAIELAAARTATLGLEELATGLDDRFRLLTGGHRTALPRHQTLRATLDWSYELLSAIERTVLHRLSIFVGGFTLEAARAVAPAADLGATEVVDCVTNLAAKSLVVVEATGTVTQYRLLETTRAYARERLDESGQLATFSRRHAAYFGALVDRANAELGSRPATEWLAAYRPQMADVRAALDWAFSSSGDPAVGVALTVAAAPLWANLSLIEECRQRVEEALDSLGPEGGRDRRREMQLLTARSTALMYTTGTVPDTRAAFATALEIAENVEDADYQLRALWGLWLDRMFSGDVRQAMALADRFASVAARAPDPLAPALADRMIGFALHFHGSQTDARRHLTRMLEGPRPSVPEPYIARFLFDPWVTARAKLALILWLQGLPDQAASMARRAIEEALALNHAVTLGNAVAQGACRIAFLTGDLVAAERFVAMLLEHSERHGLVFWHADVRGYQACLQIARGDVAGGSEMLRARLDELSRTPLYTRYDPFLAELALALSHTGRVAEGLGTIDRALARAEASDGRWYAAELLRVKGEIVLEAGAPDAAASAESLFQQSIDLARRQGAPSWELRAATSLAGLWRSQRRASHARKLLSVVYRRFDEGFGTADLVKAKALLDSLRPQRTIARVGGIPRGSKSGET